MQKKTFNTCIELEIVPLSLDGNWMDIAQDKSYLRSNQFLSFTFLLTFTFLNGESRWKAP